MEPKYVSTVTATNTGSHSFTSLLVPYKLIGSGPQLAVWDTVARMPVSIDASGNITTPNVVPNNPELSYQPDDQARQLYTVRGDDGI